MFSFLDHTYEIWTVSKERNVDVGVAYDMFRTDVQNGQALPYNTGDALPNFNFADAKEQWDALTNDEQLDAYEEWHEFKANCYTEACAAFAEGEDAMIALVAEWREETDLIAEMDETVRKEDEAHEDN